MASGTSLSPHPVTGPYEARLAIRSAMGRHIFIGVRVYSMTLRYERYQLARFFNVPESYSNGRIEMLSLPAGIAGFCRLEFSAAKKK
jgi:hypothetical protein